MPDDLVLTTPVMETALAELLWPSVTVFNRVEGRPRTRAFDRALRAEVRDALWMLTRQWQMGEFQGDDAGSPFFAKLLMDRTELTRYRPRDHATQPFDGALPLEARVERRSVPLRAAGRAIALDLRLVMGRQWLKMIADVADYRAAFTATYPVTEPDPALATDADRAAHAASFQAFAAAAGRHMDGGALYEYLTGAPGRHAYDGVAGIDPGDQQELDVRAGRFLAWFERQLTPPPTDAENAWDPERLEYSFTCSAPLDGGAEKVYVADEYHGGHLDWWAFDRAAEGAGLAGAGDPPQSPPAQPPAQTLIPTPLVFEGMPNTRWWAFEDRRTNFGDVDAATTDIAKLLFLEFALVYANDWFLVPLELPVGSISSVRGLAVTNVFGERTWIEAAGAGPDDAWQRWSMFTVASREEGAAADTSLMLPPTVPKIQEGDPIESVALIRDEVANMVWGVERVVPLPSGDAKPGAEAAAETLAYLRRIAGPAPPDPQGRVAPIRYEIMSSVPEHWIPFVGVHLEGSDRAIRLQRAGLPRVLPNTPVEKVAPRSALLREGLDRQPPVPYFVREEEVPSEGTVVEQSFQRTRWRDGRTIVWLGVRRGVGHGEGSSGLAYDRLVDVPEPPAVP
jgi:hypothetical protein